MKKVISISLLICLVLPFIGTVSWLQYHKKVVRRQIKHQIIAGIDKSELVLLSFTKEEAEQLKWKHSKEFGFNGSMYDVVEADTTENTINYWCWWDYKETNLNKELYSLLADFLGNDPKNKDAKTRFANFCQSLFYSTNKPWEAINIDSYEEKNSYYISEYTSLYFPPPTPPPKNYS